MRHEEVLRRAVDADMREFKAVLGGLSPSGRLTVMRVLESRDREWRAFWRTWKWLAFGAGAAIGGLAGRLL